MPTEQFQKHLCGLIHKANINKHSYHISFYNFLIDFSEEEQIVVDILMQYNGPNESGLNVKDAIENKINEEYPDKKIFDDRNTRIHVVVANINLEEYQVVLNFKSDKGDDINYDWNVNIDSKEIKSNNPESKYIISIVDFYD